MSPLAIILLAGREDRTTKMWSIMQKWLLITFINREIKQRRRHGNAYGKKAIRLDWQSNHSARASRFFVHFFAVATRLQRESA